MSNGKYGVVGLHWNNANHAWLLKVPANTLTNATYIQHKSLKGLLNKVKNENHPIHIYDWNKLQKCIVISNYYDKLEKLY